MDEDGLYFQRDSGESGKILINDEQFIFVTDLFRETIDRSLVESVRVVIPEEEDEITFANEVASITSGVLFFVSGVLFIDFSGFAAALSNLAGILFLFFGFVSIIYKLVTRESSDKFGVLIVRCSSGRVEKFQIQAEDMPLLVNEL